MLESKTTSLRSCVILGVVWFACNSAIYFTGRYFGFENGVASVVMPVLDPIKDFGAVCDGKNDDTSAFNNAMKVGSNHALAVQVPPNCTVRNFSVPSTSETVP